ncbi:creatininase family protein [Azospirillum rugosum]|uniref:Creatinine amidohydrolase n=1 Tax=Azospirillum rugosum TaxID=416170 RepID=A0ABS4SN45_9PROT|nr:creatininase family protein [Azospirillum rugosum]MBP2293981.1 creatinine amidohydrolase [Azospirillum rugosum]MDQ0526832.1 creatinine amidohydrolase [Azospirillum rugosum]
MQLLLSTWAEAEAYLKTSKGIILPIGSTEQHGPNGLIGTDALCAEVIARGVGDATGAMVGPTIPVGMAVHHMEFAGSMTLKPSTLIALLRDYVLSLSEHGFQRFFFVNGHGGNIASVRAAFYEIYAENRALRGKDAPDLRCTLVNWWENAEVSRLSKELFGNKEGSHATPSEVSVTQYAFPDSIKTTAMEPETAAAGGFYDARDFRRRHPDGRIGSAPGLARPEHGQRLVEAAVGAISRQYESFLGEA